MSVPARWDTRTGTLITTGLKGIDLTSGTEDPPPIHPASGRRSISITCRTHGAHGFCNLLVTREGHEVVLNPHLDGSCVLSMDEQAATELHEAIGEMLG